MPTDLEPRQRTITTQVTYWECNVLGHRHRTRQSASACISKRKGESGELKRLTRNLAMIEGLREGVSFVDLAAQHHCSDSNIIKAVNSTLEKARMFAVEHGGEKFEPRNWKRSCLVDPNNANQLNYLTDILKEREVKLRSLLS